MNNFAGCILEQGRRHRDWRRLRVRLFWDPLPVFSLSFNGISVLSFLGDHNNIAMIIFWVMSSSTDQEPARLADVKLAFVPLWSEWKIVCRSFCPETSRADGRTQGLVGPYGIMEYWCLVSKVLIVLVWNPSLFDLKALDFALKNLTIKWMFINIFFLFFWPHHWNVNRQKIF